MGLTYPKFKSQSAASRWRKGQPLLTNERTGIRAFEPSNETKGVTPFLRISQLPPAFNLKATRQSQVLALPEALAPFAPGRSAKVLSAFMSSAPAAD
jgi:hypothetical protein